MFFIPTLICVGIMLLYSVPGYALVKSRLIKPASISAFATMLLYVCQPCLTIYSFKKVPYSASLAGQMALFVLMSLILQGVFLGVFYLVFRKKHNDIKYRVCTLATTLGNCTFMGVPLLETLFPDNPEAVMFSLSYFIAMSIICWTVASYIITRDRKYMSAKKLFLNPAMISLYVTIPLWVFDVKIPGTLMDAFTLLGRMTTPMCMLILGMRLGTIRIKKLFTSPLQYTAIAIKQLAMPVVTFAVLYFLPLDPLFKQTMFILSATPVASLVLNFAEMLGEGQDTAANVVLLGTALSIGTIPLMSLLL